MAVRRWRLVLMNLGRMSLVRSCHDVGASASWSLAVTFLDVGVVLLAL